jgi:uncharacterized membrane protein
MPQNILPSPLIIQILHLLYTEGGIVDRKFLISKSTYSRNAVIVNLNKLKKSGIIDEIMFGRMITYRLSEKNEIAKAFQELSELWS